MFRTFVRMGLPTVLVCLVTVASVWLYQRYWQPVRIACLGFSDTDWAAWEDATRAAGYSLHRYDLDKAVEANLANYHVLFLRGMGLHLTDEQLNALQRAREAGTQIVVLAATNDLSRKQNTLPADCQERVDQYLLHGGEDNMVGLMHYLAATFAGRKVAVPAVVEKPLSGFFHLGGALFEDLAAYEAYLKQERPRVAANAPKVALFGPFLDPRDKLNLRWVDRLVQGLERRGAKVYPLFGAQRAWSLLEKVKPDLIISLPHGRLAPNNQAPERLAKLNVPVLGALSLLEEIDQWQADQRGMSGGFLGQSITTPELDGVIEPIAVTALEPNERAVKVRTAIPDRLDKFVARTVNWLHLRRKPNAEKRLVIVYYKGPGASALTAESLEVVPSLFHLLKRLEKEGYDLGDSPPASAEELEKLIQKKGRTIGQWALGAYEKFLDEAEPEIVPATDYAQWMEAVLSEKRRADILNAWGRIPGKQMVTERDGEPCLVVSRIRFGNVVIMPQPTVGGGDGRDDEIQSIHGTDKAPPHFYLAAYLWARFGYQADAIMHFGTHGSLEFTKGKSACLSADCWPDILIGDLPHIYPYVINNVGEALVAKRRSYGLIVSHLTPPFVHAGLYGELETLHAKIHDLRSAEDPPLEEEIRRTITQMVRKLELAKDLDLSEKELDTRLVSDDEVERLHAYVHRLKDEQVTDGRHVLGRDFTEQQVRDTVVAMLGSRAVDTVLAATGHAQSPEAQEDGPALVQALVNGVLDGQIKAEQFTAASAATVATQESVKPDPVLDPATFWGAGPESRPRLVNDPALNERFVSLLAAIPEHAKALREAPTQELDSIAAALRGEYIRPSSGGDAVFNPQAVPTGRNLYSINAEQTPTEESWRVGVRLADELLAEHKRKNGVYPKKVAFTLWGGEFIRGKGSTVAQILHLLGVRPVRDSRGTVHDVELVPAAELKRPRIDVLVQTSGQFRDAAASRIALIDKAVRLVSALDEHPPANYVREGSASAEMNLKAKGYSAAEARELATARVFGSAGNQSYGTNIMGVVEKGDTWETETEVADQYLKNMGGIYRGGDQWGTYREGLLETQLAGAEVVVQPRSSNISGPLNLDHVYEFMGGITLSIRVKTGKDPTGYFSDQRRPGQAKLTTAVAAIREEARTTLWNPRYLQGVQREGATTAATLTETVRNMYGWNVMQPSSISGGMWDETYQVMIEDRHQLGMREFFEKKNPYALQDMTAVMLETARKGFWTPSTEVLQRLATLHAELVARHGAACSYETCGNTKTQEFLASQLGAPGSEVDPATTQAYQTNLAAALQSTRPMPEVEGMQLEEKREKIEERPQPAPPSNTLALAGLVLAAVLGTILTGRVTKRT